MEILLPNRKLKGDTNVAQWLRQVFSFFQERGYDMMLRFSYDFEVRAQSNYWFAVTALPIQSAYTYIKDFEKMKALSLFEENRAKWWVYFIVVCQQSGLFTSDQFQILGVSHTGRMTPAYHYRRKNIFLKCYCNPKINKINIMSHSNFPIFHTVFLWCHTVLLLKGSVEIWDIIKAAIKCNINYIIPALKK